MAQAQNKTQPTRKSVGEFLATIENNTRRNDAHTLLDLMERVTGETATMWGPSIIGFGSYHYKYESGREGDAPMVGFSPRKQNMVLYIMLGFKPYDEKLERLGKHSTGKSCLYVNKLADVDMDVVEEMVADCYAEMKAKYHSA